MRHDEYAAHDALSLADLVRTGEVTSTELVEAAIARTDAVNPTLNAVVHRMDDTARDVAAGELPDGPFAGVPFLVKDMDGFLADEPCTFSSRSLHDYVPDHDSELFARYRRAGVVFVGKTNCPELGIYGVTEPEFRGAGAQPVEPRPHPWRVQWWVGGSSRGRHRPRSPCRRWRRQHPDPRLGVRAVRPHALTRAHPAGSRRGRGMEWARASARGQPHGARQRCLPGRDPGR